MKWHRLVFSLRDVRDRSLVQAALDNVEGTLTHIGLDNGNHRFEFSVHPKAALNAADAEKIIKKLEKADIVMPDWEWYI